MNETRKLSLWERIWKWIDDRSSAIQAVTAIAIVILTIVNVVTTLSIISQQENQLRISDRAYLSIDGTSMTPNENGSYDVGLTVTNRDQTPATNVSTSVSLSSGASTTDPTYPTNAPTLDSGYLDPNDSYTLYATLGGKAIEEISSGTNYYLTASTSYLDFSGDEHTIIAKLNANIKLGKPTITIHQEYEQK